MENIYRISADSSLINNNEVVVIESNAPSSDIPYFVIIHNENGKLKIRNEFVSRDEYIEIHRITTNISLKIGAKTGRVYEIETFSDIKKDDILNSFNSFIKKSFNTNEKKYNNASLSYLIIKKTLLKFKNTTEDKI